MSTYQKYLTDFDSHMTLRNYSPATRRAYGCALGQFFKWREREGFSGPFTQEQARSYILSRHGQGLKWQTINGDYSSMFKFYREVLRQDWDVQHIPRPRRERSLPSILSKVEVQRLIEHGSTYKHQVFMSLVYGTGLRLGEALGLRLEDIDGERRQLRVVRGKGSKDRYVSMPDCLLEVLRGYYRTYRPGHYLFTGKGQGQAWSQRAAQSSVQDAREAAKKDLKDELEKIRWVVHHGRPTAETKVIEEYLRRYICRIGISNKRLHYDKQGKNVRIEYNDYRNQQNGQAAPKAYLDLHPLVAMHQILPHQLPAYFQRVRYGF